MSPVVLARLMNLAVGVAVGSFLPFQAVWLTTKGFTPGEVGAVVASIAVGVTMVVPAWGRLADTYLGIRAAMLIGVAAAFGALILAFVAPDRAVVGACVAISATALSAAMPLVDAVAIRILPDPRSQFGAVRLFGSASLGCSALIGGSAFAVLGYEVALVPLGIAAAALAIIVGVANPVPRSAVRRGKQAPSAGTAGGRRTLALILVANAIAHAGIEAGFTFIGPRLLSLGAGVAVIGIAQAVSVVGEVVALLISGWVIRRLGVGMTFGIGVAMYATCMALWSVLTFPPLIVATRLVSGGGLALTLLAAALALARRFSGSHQGTAQSLNLASSFGLGASIGTLVGGVLYAAAGPTAMFMTAAIVAGVGAILGRFAMDEPRTDRPSAMVASPGVGSNDAGP